jgi:hypothetical protein
MAGARTWEEQGEELVFNVWGDEKVLRWRWWLYNNTSELNAQNCKPKNDYIYFKKIQCMK